jgi:hypothetical protein
MRIGFKQALITGGYALALAFAPAAAASPQTEPALKLDRQPAGVSVVSLDLGTVMPDLAAERQGDYLDRFGKIGDGSLLFDGTDFFDRLDFDVASVICGYAGGAFGGMFDRSELQLPYLAATAQSGYAGARMMLADGLRFSFAQAFLRSNPGFFRSEVPGFASNYGAVAFDGRYADTVLAGLNWNFAKWAGMGFTASQTVERDGALGNAAVAAERARIVALGLSAHVGFGSGWVTTLSYNQARAQLSLNPGFSAATGDGILRSKSYCLSVAKQGLFGHDALGLSLSRPSGGFNPAAPANEMQFQFYGRDKLFADMMPETDIEVGYITSFLDAPVALQANASYQVNYNGLNKDSVSFISRAKIKF